MGLMSFIGQDALVTKLSEEWRYSPHDRKRRIASVHSSIGPVLELWEYVDLDASEYADDPSKDDFFRCWMLTGAFKDYGASAGSLARRSSLLASGRTWKELCSSIKDACCFHYLLPHDILCDALYSVVKHRKQPSRNS
jgi:hypothetical protein